MISKGISPKAVLAFLFPFISTVVGLLSNYVVTGQFDETALRMGVAALLASCLAAIGAYAGRPGEVVGEGADVEDDIEDDVEDDVVDE